MNAVGIIFWFHLLIAVDCLPSVQNGPRKKSISGLYLSPVFVNPRKMVAIGLTKHAEGLDLNLPCKAIGNPRIKYSWFVNGQPFKKVYRKHLKRTRSIMKIKRLRDTDQGVYTCVASNKYGNLSFSYYLKVKGQRTKVPVFYDYNIMMRQQYTFRSTGNTVRFRCQAKGTFPIRYTWLKNGQPFAYQSRVIKNKVEMKQWNLRIRKLQLTDGGNYTCIAQNKHGSVAFSFYLTMLRTRSGGPPRVITRSRGPTIKARVGQNISLECLELTSLTLPFVVWHKWSKNVDEKTALRTVLSGKKSHLCQSIDPKKYDTFTVESAEELNNIQWLYDQTRPYGLRLNLKQVTLADSGIYTCTASNVAGEDLAKMELQVGDNAV